MLASPGERNKFVARGRRTPHDAECMIMHEYMTAKEVADLLRIKERKLYDLCAENALPVTKVTGKLIFPRAALMAWLHRNTDYGRDLPSLREHPPVAVGSHDPLLEWALRMSQSGLATYFDGSQDGLMRMSAGQATLAGIHFHGPGDTSANVVCVKSEMPFEPVVLIEWAKRSQVIAARREDSAKITSVGDMAQRRIAYRQAGAGSQLLLLSLLRRAGVREDETLPAGEIARSETDVGQMIVSGQADTGICIEATARRFGLHFVPVTVERFDLLIWRRAFFGEPVQRLLELARSEGFARRAGELGGYDVSACGTVHYNGG